MFDQFAWKSIKGRTTRIGIIDDLFSVLKNGFYSFWDATPEVQRVVFNTAMQKSILPIEPPSPNSTWVLDFHGPALDCGHADNNIYDAVLENMRSAIINATLVDYGDDVNLTLLASSFGYLAWAPEDNGHNSLPFLRGYVDDKLYNVRPGTVFDMLPEKFGPQIVDTLLQLFMLTFPHMLEQGNRTNKELNHTTQDATFLTCTMYNASYTANFTYVNGQQNINLSNLQRLNEVGYLNSVSTSANSKDLAGMQNRTAMETFAYQSIMAQFGSLLVGNINKETYHVESPTMMNGDNRILPNASSSSFRIDDTSIMTTGLSNTKELRNLSAASTKTIMGMPSSIFGMDGLPSSLKIPRFPCQMLWSNCFRI